MREQLEAALAGRYSVEKELGRGGMASVWLATDLTRGRSVAIKVLHAELAGPVGADRFAREVQVNARLTHPGIVPVLDSGTFAGPGGVSLPWFAMPYIDGESLRARLERDRQLAVPDAIAITVQVAEALKAAHDQGIVHRDVKPENLLLSAGRVYVADFGIAKALVDLGGDKLTSTGIVIGTPAYMSPEQSAGDTLDARSDQYALACVQYEMLAGEPPFTGPTAQAIMARRIAEPARPLRSVRSAVPANVESAILKALERVPADRFGDVAAFASALQQDTGEITSRVAPVRRQSARPILLGAAAIVVLSGAGWWFGRHRAKAPRNPQVAALVERGLQEYKTRTQVGIGAAIQDYRSAIALDSSSADAWAGLSASYARAVQRRFVFPGQSTDSLLQLAVTAADRSLAIDSRNANVWVTRAVVAQQLDPTDNQAVFKALNRALALDSNDARAWHYLAVADAETGHLDRSIPEWRRAVRSDSSYVEGVAFLALGFYWTRQYDSASKWADSAVALDPTYLLARTTQGQVAAMRGDAARGRAAFETARRLSTGVEVINAMVGRAQVEAMAGKTSDAHSLLQQAESLAKDLRPPPLHTAVYIAAAYAELGERDKAFRWLEGYTPRDDLHFQLHLRCDPPMDKLVGDPRFAALVLKPAACAQQH